VDLGRQILSESSRTDENENGNSARAVSIASSTGLRSISGASEGVASIRLEAERCEHIWSPSSSHNFLPKRAYKIVVDGIESHPFHLEIEDDCLLVHQATDPKRPSLTSFFPKRGKRTGKRL
jgi:hypothetical protein